MLPRRLFAPTSHYRHHPFLSVSSPAKLLLAIPWGPRMGGKLHHLSGNQYAWLAVMLGLGTAAIPVRHHLKTDLRPTPPMRGGVRSFKSLAEALKAFQPK